MIRVALKAIAARRARMVLTSLAIILGVGMVSGALTLSDTLRHAAQQHVGVGGHVRIQGRGPVRPFTVSGVATFGAVNSIGSATFAVFDLREAQQLFGESGRYDSILVAARPGASVTALRTALQT